MSTSPWVKWFSADFLNGISDLEPNEIAVYSVVLNLIYDNEGPIKDDAIKIGRRCNMRPTSAEKSLASLYSAGKITRENGVISNHRCEKEIKSRQKVSEKSSESANTRWKNHDKKPNEINEAPMRTQSVGICETDAIYKPEPDKKEESSSNSWAIAEKSASPDKPKDDGWPPGYFKIWYAIYPRKKSPDLAERTLAKIRRSKRVSWPDLMAATRRFAASPLDPKFTPHPSTWLNAGSWNDEPDRQSPIANGTNGAGSPPDQVLSIVRRRLTEVGPTRWPASQGGFDLDGNETADDLGSRPPVIDHDGQKAGCRADDDRVSALFFPSPSRSFGSH